MRGATGTRQPPNGDPLTGSRGPPVAVEQESVKIRWVSGLVTGIEHTRESAPVYASGSREPRGSGCRDRRSGRRLGSQRERSHL